ncbi:NU6M oxidoreductase, partial [Xiphorhynchus elegans]|nr:NU6M oxidoreductase [Xiphorhynchus elegans]
VGLALASVARYKWLLSLGPSFMLLILFMGFLGGVFLIFVYSVSLVVDPFPEAGGVAVYGTGLV